MRIELRPPSYVQEQFSCLTGSMLLRAADGWQIRLKSIYNGSFENLVQRVNAEVEAEMSIPLEQQDVPRLRAWLTAYEVFHFQAEA